MIRVADKDDIETLSQALMADISLLDLNADFYLERMQFGPGGGAKLAARFSGSDASVLRDLAQQAERVMRADGNLVDIRHNWRDKWSL